MANVKLNPFGDESVARAFARQELRVFREDAIGKDPHLLADAIQEKLTKRPMISAKRLTVDEYAFFEDCVDSIIHLSGGKIAEINYESKVGKFSNKTPTKLKINLGFGVFDDPTGRKTFAPMMSNLLLGPRGIRFSWERACDHYGLHCLERLLQRDGRGDSQSGGISRIVSGHFENIAMLHIAKMSHQDLTAVRNLPMPCEDGLILGETCFLNVDLMKSREYLNKPNVSVVNIDKSIAKFFDFLQSLSPAKNEFGALYVPVWFGRTYISRDLMRDEQIEYAEKWNELRRKYKKENEMAVVYLAAGERYGAGTQVLDRDFSDFAFRDRINAMAEEVIGFINSLTGSITSFKQSDEGQPANYHLAMLE